MQSWTLISRSADETRRFGRCLGKELQGGEVVALSGDLGAGKTCLTQGLAAGVGVAENEAVTSPSYTLLNPYRGRIPLYHFDLYRLSDAEDLESIGFFDFLREEGVAVVEWAERIEEWANERLEISLAISGEEERQITLRAGDDVHMALLVRLQERWEKGRDK